MTPRSSTLRTQLHTLAKPMSLAIVIALSNLSVAALKTAAGPGNAPSGTNGFDDAVKFLDNIATYLIYIAIPGGALGLIAGGGMLMAGSPEGPKWITRTVIGVGVVLLSKGLTA